MSINPMSKEYIQALITEFRANSGQCRGWEDNSLLLLTTIGAKSGRRHTVPVSFTTDGDRVVVLAANGGEPNRPAWYHNLLAHPEVTVELGSEIWQTRAVVAEGQERERLFNKRAEEAPFVLEMQRKMTHQIPVVILRRPGD